MFGETAIISCFFKICLCIIMIIQYKVRGGQPQRPVNFITRSHWDSNSKITTEARHGTRIKLPFQIIQGVSPQRQDTERMSSYRFRYTNAGPCNVSETRCAYPTFTRVANKVQGQTIWPKIRSITTEARHGARVKLPLQIYPASPCNASRTRSAYPTATRVASI